LHQAAVLHKGETTLQVLDEPRKPTQSKSYMWLMAVFNQRSAFYSITHLRGLNRSSFTPAINK